MNYISPEVNRVARDLSWLSTSPEIISVAALRQAKIPSLNAGRELLSCAFGDVPQISSTNRLGLYFEQLCRFQFEQHPEVNIVSANQQIIHEKHTIGEFDLIIEHLKTRIHFELAVKFYLQIGPGDQLSHWVGPNLKDRFDNKYERLVNHQLKLSENPFVKAWLDAESICIDEIGLITRGRLYYPYACFMEADFLFPVEVEKSHLQGFWMSGSQFRQEQSLAEFSCFELPRGFWLSEVTSHEILTFQPFDGDGVSQVTAVVLWHDNKEHMRGFIVPEEWLAKAQERISI
ncbi:MAG: DUF1853 family protein [Gammaproteobacteria bacterium]|nr:DUF1853 family protein [Gammaproteobacteria bacterium]NNJ71860.1 DUF1853 family protein [Enterobacterales bacterium]